MLSGPGCTGALAPICQRSRQQRGGSGQHDRSRAEEGLETVAFFRSVCHLRDHRASARRSRRPVFEPRRREGATALQGRGLYTGEDRDVIFTVVSRTELDDLTAIVHALDPEAFVVISDVHEALGEGFKEHRRRYGRLGVPCWEVLVAAGAGGLGFLRARVRVSGARSQCV